ncbi:2-hydroxy-3-oxopropionate reductase [archaeon HR01]|nr:2-hydroxy-3-oxopropionate reductase [archaeon HR01]
MSSYKVGFIGLGRMGSRMAENILAAGFPLAVWNRTIEKARSFADSKGASVADTPKELASKSDVIISMLTEPWITEDVILGTHEMKGKAVIDGFIRGKVVIDMSTNHPSSARKMASALGGVGCHFLDAPVMGGPFVAARKGLTILASGDEDVFEKVLPLLQSMGQKVLYVGDVGTGMTVKLLLNLHLWVMMASYAECVAIGAKLGVTPRKLTEIINNTVVKNYVTEFKAGKILENDWKPDADMSVAVKDLRLVADVVQEVGAPMLLGSIARDLFTATMHLGFSDYDVMAIALLYSRMAGVDLYSKT